MFSTIGIRLMCTFSYIADLDPILRKLCKGGSNSKFHQQVHILSHRLTVDNSGWHSFLDLNEAGRFGHDLAARCGCGEARDESPDHGINIYLRALAACFFFLFDPPTKALALQYDTAQQPNQQSVEISPER